MLLPHQIFYALMNFSSSAQAPGLSHCQCYAQSTSFPRPTQKQVGEDPGNEAKAQLPAAVRELRPRQNEPRPERVAERPEGAAEIDLTHECAILGLLGSNIIQFQVRHEEN